MFFRFLLLVCLLAVTVFALEPGLTGTFLLDDFQNLKVLDYAQGLTWHELLSFGFSQFSGATRILPHLSFALQADAWPGLPGKFILFNILLHLANGLLVYLLAEKLACISGQTFTQRIGLLAAAVWLLSPLQVAGVLYIVQRINQMAAFFVFAGALAYLHGRSRMEHNAQAALLWMSFGVIGCGSLAVLSKENGALLTLLLLVAEVTLLPTLPNTHASRWSRRLLLYAPLILLIGMLTWQFPQIMVGYEKREFGLAERLLTQPIILLDYVSRFLLPRGLGLGLYHDDFPVVGWPPSAVNLSKILSVFAVLLTAVVFRCRWPIAAFGVLWFIAAHVLESSFIPLELYFEHRNYVPLFGPAFALAVGAVTGIDRARGIVKLFVVVLVAGWLAVAAGVTYSQAKLWGNPTALLEVWLHDHPESARANSAIASLLVRQGFVPAAEKRLNHLVHGESPRLGYYALWLQLGCDGELALPRYTEVLTGFKSASYSTAPVNSLATIADRMEGHTCPRIDPLIMIEVVQILENNPAYATSRQRLQPLRGRFLELGGRYQEALIVISDAYRKSGDPEIGFIELRLLNVLGRSADLESALAALEKRIHSGGIRYLRYQRDVERWHAYLERQRAAPRQE